MQSTVIEDEIVDARTHTHRRFNDCGNTQFGSTGLRVTHINRKKITRTLFIPSRKVRKKANANKHTHKKKQFISIPQPKKKEQNKFTNIQKHTHTKINTTEPHAVK